MTENCATQSEDCDKSAIARVIREETEAFRRRDLAAWSEFFVQDDRLRDVYASPHTGLTVFQGWDEVRTHMERTFASETGVRMVDYGQENLQVQIAGDVAWVVFDGWALFSSGERDTTYQARILERHDDRWRIIYSSFVQVLSLKIDAEQVALDADGRVVWATDAAMSRLRDHPWLTVSAGRLRAHRRSWDQELQSAIMEAGRHQDFVATYQMALEMGGAARYPVILGPTDEGGVAVVRLTVRDGLTYVEVGQDGDLDRRMRVAQQVFGLSEGQARVARCIAQGLGPKALASELGISVNTARTHLTRLYEKTGVNSQTALVRLLLSVG